MPQVKKIKQKPSMNIATLDAKLFTTMFDNTARTDNKYDVRVTNEADVSFQKPMQMEQCTMALILLRYLPMHLD